MVEIKFNSHGKLKMDNDTKIKAGDTVEYSYADNNPNDRTRKMIVTLRGTWDGDKVSFNDKKNTVVKTTHWLTLIEE